MIRLHFIRYRLAYAVLLSLVGQAQTAAAFSALSHEAVVDSCWDRGLVPVLDRAYPGATAAQLRVARAYAYGGALLQDLGYFPGNTALFSDLTHYVRPGDFVRALLDEAHDRNELAFALGALSHYVADACGHPTGANAVTELVFPELRPRLGNHITYAQAPQQHAQVEFAFDVAQTTAGTYRSEAFHAAIGLQVSRTVLERAFILTYGLELKQVLPHVGAGLTAFHFVATELLPAAVRASEYLTPGQLRQLPPADRTRYYERLNTCHFQRRCGLATNHLSLGMRGLVVLTPTLPRLGIASLLAFRSLPPAAGAAMRASFAESVGCFQARLTNLAAPLPNLNLDTGQPNQAGSYPLADRTYAAWARRLARARRPQGLPDAARHDLQTYFTTIPPGPAGAPPISKQTRLDLQQLLATAGNVAQ